MNRTKLLPKIIVGITLGILIFSFLSVIQAENPRSNVYIGDIVLEDEQFNNENLKTASHWNLLTPILIDDANPNKNWNKTASDNDWCSGSGTYSDPYIIENVKIYSPGSIIALTIQHSNVFFIIRNCTIQNTENQNVNIGIRLSFVTNGQLINNNCSLNQFFGIHIYFSNNNTLSGNIANYNYDTGIIVHTSDNNTISGNSASNCIKEGVELVSGCDNNNISGNTVNDNFKGIILKEVCNNNTITGNTINDNDIGIFLRESDGNKVFGNTLIGNRECIEELTCKYNIIEDNDCRKNGGEAAIPGYNLIFLIGAICTISAIIIKKRIKS